MESTGVAAQRKQGKRNRSGPMSLVVLHHTQQPPDKVTATLDAVHQHLLLCFLAKSSIFILIFIFCRWMPFFPPHQGRAQRVL